MQQRISSVLFRTGWGCLRAIPAWVFGFSALADFAQAPDPTFRVDVDLTLIDVQVVDTATGQPIRKSTAVRLRGFWPTGSPGTLPFSNPRTPPWTWRSFWTCRVSNRPSGSPGGSSAAPTQLGSA